MRSLSSALGAHDHENSAQAAFLILRYSASRKSDHLMRMVPPSIYEEAAEEHDAAVLHTLSLLMHASDPLRLDARTETKMMKTLSISLACKRCSQ